MRAQPKLTHIGPPVLALLILCTLAMAPLSTAAAADIYVLLAGGTDEVHRFRIDGGQVVSQSGLPIERDDATLTAYTDIVALPGGELLLAEGTGPGILQIDGQSGEELMATSPWEEEATPRSLVVERMVGPNAPERILASYDPPGRLLLYDLFDNADLWTRVPTRGDSSARIERAIALGEDRWAQAIRWPQAGLSTVQVTDAEDMDSPQMLLWSDADAAGSDPTLADLHPVRDLEGSLDGDLLITSRDQIALVDTDGELLWQFGRGQLDIAGQLEGARYVDDHYIALIARQPGLWNQPHTNHRLYLLDPSASSPIQSMSPSLDAAPIAVAAADGQAPTGRRGHLAGASNASPQLSDLALDDTPLLEPASPPIDDSTAINLAVANEGDEAVALRRLEAQIAAGDCDVAQGFQRWGASTPLTIEANDVRSTGFALEPAESLGLSVGPACLRVLAVAPDLRDQHLAPHVDLELTPPQGRESEVDVDILSDRRRGDIDAEELSERYSSGSCSALGDRRSTSAWFFLVLLVALRSSRSGRSPVFGFLN